MPNALYNAFTTARNTAAFDWTADTIVAYAVNLTAPGTTYTFNAAHADLASITEAARIAVTPALTGKTVTGQILDSADPVLPSVSGNSIEGVVLFNQTRGYPIAFYDGLSLSPSGNNVNVVVPASGWVYG